MVRSSPRIFRIRRILSRVTRTSMGTTSSGRARRRSVAGRSSRARSTFCGITTTPVTARRASTCGGTAPATIQQTFTGLVPGAQYTFSLDYSGLSKTQSIASVPPSQGGAFTTLATLSPAANGVSTMSDRRYPDDALRDGHLVDQSVHLHRDGDVGDGECRMSSSWTVEHRVVRTASSSPVSGRARTSVTRPTAMARPWRRMVHVNIVTGYNATTHTAPATLGATIDTDADGVPSAAADGDDITASTTRAVSPDPSRSNRVRLRA